MTLRVLVTNITLATRTGTEFFTRDLALGLERAGHPPVVYSPDCGSVAEEIRAHEIEVVDDLERITTDPDLVHGHHNLTTMIALTRFPDCPAVFMVHDRLQWLDEPPAHPRIRRYVAVDENCLARITSKDTIAPEQTRVIQNAVDLDRFRQRPPLPPAPRRALVFSNYATEESVIAAVRAACAQTGIELEAAGSRAGVLCEDPENILGRYDLVFGKGRCALEALAVGCAVVLCDVQGVGGMVTPQDFERMRRLNFGMRTLTAPVTTEVLAREILRFDASASLEVTLRTRREAGLDRQVDQFLTLYREVLDEAPAVTDARKELRALSVFLRPVLPRLRERASASDLTERALRDQVEQDLRHECARLGRTLDEMHTTATWQLRDRVLGLPVVGALARRLARRSAGKSVPGAA